MVSIDRRTMLTMLGAAGVVPVLAGVTACEPTPPPAAKCGPTDFSALISPATRANITALADQHEMTAAEAAAWRCGVNCLSFQLNSGLSGGLMPYLANLQDGPPEVIRWTVSWDRPVLSPTARQDWAVYWNTFDYCTANGVRLILNIWVKSRFWLGDTPRGCSLARPSSSLNFPADVRASYGQFVKDLYRAVRSRNERVGADPRLICIEAWNEPDIRWAMSVGINRTYPWITTGFEWAYFSGGSAMYGDLHRVLDTPWTDDPPT